MGLNHRDRKWNKAFSAASGLQAWTCYSLIMVLLLCGVANTYGATTAAGISGVVTDPSGSVIVGATVEAKAVDTGIIEKHQTNDDGFYSFLNLSPGAYEIEVRQAGFVTFRQ